MAIDSFSSHTFPAFCPAKGYMGRGCSTPHPGRGFPHRFLQQAGPLWTAGTTTRAFRATSASPTPPLGCTHPSPWPSVPQPAALWRAPPRPLRVFCAINTHVLQPRPEPSFRSLSLQRGSPISWLSHDPHARSTEDSSAPLLRPPHLLCSAGSRLTCCLSSKSPNAVPRLP